MLYAIIGTETPHRSAARPHAQPRHLERVQALVQQGRLATTGPVRAIDAAAPRPDVGADSLRPATLPDREPALAGRHATDAVSGDLDDRLLRRVLP